MRIVVVDLRDIPATAQVRATRQLASLRRLTSQILRFGVPLPCTDAPLAALQAAVGAIVHPAGFSTPTYGDAAYVRGEEGATEEAAEATKETPWCAGCPRYVDDSHSIADVMAADGPCVCAWLLVGCVRRSHSDEDAWSRLRHVDELLAPIADDPKRTVVVLASRLRSAHPDRAHRSHVESFVGVRAMHGFCLPQLPQDGTLADTLRHLLASLCNVPLVSPSAAPARTVGVSVASLVAAQWEDVGPLDARVLFVRTVVPRQDRCSTLAVVVRFGLRDLACPVLYTTDEWDGVAQAERCRRLAEHGSEWPAPTIYDVAMYDRTEDPDEEDDLYADAAFAASPVAQAAVDAATSELTLTLQVPIDLWLHPPLPRHVAATRPCEPLAAWLPMSVRRHLATPLACAATTVWLKSESGRAERGGVVPRFREGVMVDTEATFACATHVVHLVVRRGTPVSRGSAREAGRRPSAVVSRGPRSR